MRPKSGSRFLDNILLNVLESINFLQLASPNCRLI